MTGTVETYLADRHYGFIRPDDGSSDVFVHADDVQGLGFGSLVVGQRVEFEVEDAPKGPRAANVTVLADDRVVA